MVAAVLRAEVAVAEAMVAAVLRAEAAVTEAMVAAVLRAEAAVADAVEYYQSRCKECQMSNSQCC